MRNPPSRGDDHTVVPSTVSSWDFGHTCIDVRCVLQVTGSETWTVKPTLRDLATFTTTTLAGLCPRLYEHYKAWWDRGSCLLGTLCFRIFFSIAGVFHMQNWKGFSLCHPPDLGGCDMTSGEPGHCLLNCRGISIWVTYRTRKTTALTSVCSSSVCSSSFCQAKYLGYKIKMRKARTYLQRTYSLMQNRRYK